MDWENPPQLAVRKRPIRNIELLAALKARRVKHKPGKAHSTNRERSREMRAKANRRRFDASRKEKTTILYHAAVRAYWQGLSDAHP